MKITRPVKKPVLALLIKRTVSFFFALCLLIIFLYSIGTLRGFMDSTQMRLLRLGARAGLFLWVGAGYGAALDCYLLFQGKKYYIRSLISYIIVGAFGMAAALFSAFILVITQGKGG
ncbi:MAG: hypothetical protein LBD13_00600 [Spirochaetaceae bacterium]|jgi:hypothetical protein|nr:hypothetical protein [Spirochaetaceae bacterium]